MSWLREQVRIRIDPEAVVAERSEYPAEIGKHGGAREGAGRRSTLTQFDHETSALEIEPEPIQVRHTNLKKGGSETADYLTARIARDYPDIHERMKAVELVRREIEAGQGGEGQQAA